MELRSGKRMRQTEAAVEEPPFQPTGPSAIEATLPDDVLLHIFKQLEQDEDRRSLSVVSKRWRRLTGALCTKVTVSEIAGGDRLLQVLQYFGPGVQTLNLNYVPFLCDSDLQALPLLCPNLTSVMLDGHNNFSDVGLCALAQACGPRLLELNISSCQGLSFHGVANACQFLPNLRLLDLTRVKGRAKVTDVDPSVQAAFAVRPTTPGSDNEKKKGGKARSQGGRTRSLSEERHINGSSIHHPLVGERCGSESEGTMWDCRFRRAGSHFPNRDAPGERDGSETDVGSLDSAVTAIGNSCPMLRTLLLRDCGAPTQLSDDGLNGLTSGPCAKMLTTLDLSFCEGVTNAGLLNLAQRCPGLTELGLACLKVTSVRDVSAAGGLTSAGLAHVLAQCTELTSLDLSGNTLSPEWFQQLRLVSKSLVKLELTQCEMKPNELWSRLLGEATWSALTHLELLECADLDDDDLRPLAVAGVALKILKISGCDGVTDFGLQCLGEVRGGQLEELVLRKTRLGNMGPYAFLPGAPWPKLHTLAISESDDINDDTLESVALHCSALTSLEAGCGFYLNGSALTSVLDKCKKLQKLMLFGNSGIDDIDPGPPCPSLRQLDVSNCALPVKGFQTLAVRCPNLEIVDVSENKYLNQEGLMALAEGCTRLEVLDLRRCPKVTDSAIEMLLEASSSLRRLFVNRKKVSQRLESFGLKQGCRVVCCPSDCGR